MSTIAASQACVWLMAVGGGTKWNGPLASSCVFLELGEGHNELTK